jgi:tripartite motif-containing protein 71
VSTPQTFECPNCGASLDYHDGDEPTIRCPYCSTSVVVPEELRRAQSAQPAMASVNIQLGAAGEPVNTRVLPGCFFPIVFLAILGGIIVGVAALVFEDDSPVKDVLDSVTSGYASVAFTFGSEGIGQGMFEDARHVAVDGQGNIYVGEYSDPSRIQVFDSTGQFLALWVMENETPLRSMAVTRDGTLYAIYQSDLWRYDGMSGDLLGQVVTGDRFDCVTLTADGKLVAAVDGGFSDDIIRMDTEGNIAMRKSDALEDISEQGAIEIVAVDGLGNIYVLAAYDGYVFKFSPDGQYLNRFGGEGDEPGQFRAPGTLTIDGQGRVYVTDFKGVQVFDSDGRYIDVFDFPGFGYGLTFNNAGQLLVANGGNKITVFDINTE